jgi:hypothetical protein
MKIKFCSYLSYRYDTDRVSDQMIFKMKKIVISLWMEKNYNIISNGKHYNNGIEWNIIISQIDYNIINNEIQNG